MVSHLRIAVGTVLSNSLDSFIPTIENFINQGISDFYVIDHLSDPPITHADFDQLSKKVNIQLLQKRTLPFYQGALMSYLVFLAQLDEFDVFIPCDSDEFYLPMNYTENLRQLITSHFENTSDVGFLVKVENFVQSSEVIDFTLENALKVKYRIRKTLLDDKDKAGLLDYSLLNRILEFKIIFKLEKNLRYTVGEGSHNLRIGGNSIEMPFDSSIVIAHIPYRSRMSLASKVKLGERRRLANFTNDVGWQNQLLVGASQESLDEFWERNSYFLNHEGVVFFNGESSCLEFDPLLTNSFAQIIEATAERSKVDNSSELIHTTRDFLGHSFDFLGEFMRFLGGNERDRAIAERDRAIAERDRAIAERDGVLSSTIWKVFTGYRWLRRKFCRSCD